MISRVRRAGLRATAGRCRRNRERRSRACRRPGGVPSRCRDHKKGAAARHRARAPVAVADRACGPPGSPEVRAKNGPRPKPGVRSVVRFRALVGRSRHARRRSHAPRPAGGREYRRPPRALVPGVEKLHTTHRAVQVLVGSSREEATAVEFIRATARRRACSSKFHWHVRWGRLGTAPLTAHSATRLGTRRLVRH